MEKINTVDLILIGLIFMLLVIMLAAITFWRSDSGKCLSSPLPYGVRQLEKTYTDDVTCSCTSLKYVGQYFLVTNETVTLKQW